MMKAARMVRCEPGPVALEQACNYERARLHRSRRRLLLSTCWCFFFFQAEDGIRDDLVTGVQTCALPIFGDRNNNRIQIFFQELAVLVKNLDAVVVAVPDEQPAARIHGERVRDVELAGTRSEERRVGKECRSRWSPYH